MNKNLNEEKDQHKDPVCNMVVSSDSEYHYHYAGNDYYFCSEHCLHKFKDHPEHYLDKHPSPSLEKQCQYACPMHLEERQ